LPFAAGSPPTESLGTVFWLPVTTAVSVLVLFTWPVSVEFDAPLPLQAMNDEEINNIAKMILFVFISGVLKLTTGLINLFNKKDAAYTATFQQ
jgi:hypothetical protein